MSFDHHLSFSLPTKTPTQNSQAKPEHDSVKNTFELIDLAPVAEPSHQPQPPSPLLTSAPDSPPYFPFARSLSCSSLSDLDSTIKPLPEPLIPLRANPSSLASSRTLNKTMAMPNSASTASSNMKSPPVTAKAWETVSSTHFSSYLRPTKEDTEFDNFLNCHPASYQGSVDWEPFYEDVEDENDDLDDMPPGFPYKDWRGYALLALEYLKVLQRLLLGFMEQDCRWGGARHTI